MKRETCICCGQIRPLRYLENTSRVALVVNGRQLPTLLAHRELLTMDKQKQIATLPGNVF